MNSLAALSRALSTRRLPPVRQPSTITSDDLKAAYELVGTSPPSSPILSPKTPETQHVEDVSEGLQLATGIQDSPASAYPSPPPTPQSEVPSTPIQDKMVSSPSPPTPLVRKLSRRQTAAVERAAKALPVRVAVQVYKLIRRVLAILGIRIAEPPSLEGPVEIRSPPIPAQLERPPSYEVAVQRAAPPIGSRWPVLPFRRRKMAAGRRESEQHKPSTALSVLERRKTLVLDLDETLIHSTSRIGGLPSTGGGWGGSGLKVRVVEVVLEGKSVVYHVYKRPWVDQFLRKVAMWYTVVVFTASVQEYADPVIDWLDAGSGIIEGRLFRESCIYSNGIYIKDLSVLGPDTDLSRVCLVDNSPSSFAKNQANGIPIEGFISDPHDQGLLDLLPLLDSLRFTQDVRRVLGLRAFSPAAIAA